jgi:hypothetical protein
LSTITVCDDGQSFLDQSANMAKILLMSYEKKLINALAKQYCFEAEVRKYQKLFAHIAKVFKTKTKEKDDFLSYLVENYEDRDAMILEQFDNTVNTLKDGKKAQ